MIGSIRAGSGLAALAFAIATSHAAPAAAQVTLDAKTAAAAFGARERVIDASLSPDGTKVAFVSPGPQQSTVVQVLDTKSGGLKPVNMMDGKPFTLSGCNWASDARMVCTLYGVTNYGGGPLLAYQRLIGMNADGTEAVPLGMRERTQQNVQQSDGRVIDWRDGKTDQVLVIRNYVPSRFDGVAVGGNLAGLAVDLLDTRSAEVTRVESVDPRATSYVSDGQGAVRIMGRDPNRMATEWRAQYEFLYRKAGDRTWLPFSTYDGVGDRGLYPLAVDGKNNVAYALDKQNGRDALYRVSLDGSLKRDLVFAHPQVDVDGVIRVGRSGRVVGARYATEKPEVHYIDPDYEKLVNGLGRALSATPLIRIVDSSADETVHLIHASSDTDPGRYFLYNQVKKSLVPLAQDRPELAGVKLGVVKPITYKAADGTTIPAYLTLPPGAESAKGLPAIVMPHGGPASRDEWGFDWLAQFFTNRGYAVLQPNYRGSSGFGQQWFQENGFKSWKTAVGDVNDAGRWLVSEGIADPAKLAIVGWSYGGYAALQSQVVDPALFKAVVAIAPVTDLGMLRDEQKGFTNMTVARNYIGDGPHLEEGSPARHAAKFQSPVLMFHGAKDINVGVAEARHMDKRLKSAGKKTELVVYPDIDHQLRDSQVRTDMLTRADAFLTKALK
jgi:dipeptidyl aminopeptidase/acylaminoacyl peptidase